MKKYLLTWAVIGTLGMLAANNACAKGNGVQTQSVVKDEDKLFHIHFNQLLKNVEGVNFSFGDTKLLRRALKAIASMPHGRELLMAVPADIAIRSARSLPRSDLGAYYNFKTRDILVLSDFLRSTDFGTGVEMKGVLYFEHELRHAAQDARGLFMRKMKPSVEQIMTVSKLSEAETRAWGIVSNLTDDYFSQDAQITLKSIDNFLKEKFNPHSEQAEILFQKCLHQSGKDFLKAQKLMVGTLIIASMSPHFYEDPLWRDTYDAQSILHVLNCMIEDNISPMGNKTAFHNALKYYKTTYGIEESDINKPHVGKAYQKMQKQLETAVQTGIVTDELKTNIQKLLDQKRLIDNNTLTAKTVNAQVTDQNTDASGLDFPLTTTVPYIFQKRHQGHRV